MKKLLFLFGLLALFGFEGWSQSACATCTTVTQNYTVNLSSNPNNTYTVTSIRDGKCCNGTGGSDRCIRFEVTVHPSAAQIQFLVSTGNNGTWQIDCQGTVYTPNQKPCLNGLTSFCITYCNPGGSADTYTISTSTGLYTGADLSLRAGCAGQLTVNGLNESSILWNSVFPGAAGAYNSYLSCTAACDTTTITPAAGAPAYVDYQVCGSATGCAVGTYCDTQRVYISPALTVAITPTAPVICSGTAVTLTTTASGGLAPYTYTWSPGGASTATLSASVAGTYTVNVNDATAGCGPVTQTVTVGSSTTPTITSASTATICSGGTVSIPFTANTPSTYSWVASDNPNTTGESLTTQTTATLSNAIVNNSTSVQTVVYTVTPTSTGGCPGSVQIVTVTVNPSPTATATPASQTICSGGATSIALTSNTGGTTFAWTVTQTNVTGASASSGATIAQTLTATTTSAGTAVYTITPTAGGCAGTPIVASVTVNPIPSATATPAASSICSGGATAIALTSNMGGTTFAWTVSQSGVSGASSSTGSNITQTLTATGSSPGTATYTITPSVGSCAGVPIVATVTVNPVPSVTATPSSQSLCSGGATSVALTSNVAGATFSWTVSQTNVTGASAGSGATIAQTLTATGTSAGTAVYTVTPAAAGCPGSAITVTITVNPIPSATATPASQSICSGSASSVALTSNIAGTTFSWTVNQTNITGASASSGTVIAQTLTATTSSAGTAVYTITPTVGGCPGTAITATVTVNPLPTVTATPSSQTLCSGGVTGVALTSNVAGATFSWTVSQTGVSGASNSSGTSITQTLTATGASAGTATYTITPAAAGCAGSPVVVTVTVNPTPSATATPSSSNLCSGNATSIALTSNVSGTTFSWTVSQTNVSGASASSGSTIAQTLTATTSAAGTAVYTITPTAAGCPGTPITATVTVSPAPSATATPSSQNVCSGNAASIALTSNVGGTTFAWTVTQTGASGASAGSGANITQTLTATGASVGTAVYTITPTAAGCSGTPIVATVSVNPAPSATATPSSQSICSNNPTSIVLTSNVPGTTFNWTVTQTNITGASASSGTVIAQTLTATTSSAGTAVYTITPSVGGCPGPSITASITVNPAPSMTATPATQTLCSGNPTSIALSSGTGGTTFAWTVTQTNVTGASASSGATIAQTLSATSSVNGTAVYTITPTAGGCAGTPVTVTVTVRPLPSATATPSSQSICSGGATAVVLTSNVAGTTFAWTVAQSGVSGASNSSGSSITQTLTTTGASAGTASYTVTPTANTCAGAAIVVTVTVNPTPTATATPASSSICSGATTSISLTSNVSGTTFAWTAGQSGVTGAANGSGATIAQILSTTTTTAGTATYTITPTAGTCPGAAIVATVTVNPVPAMTSASSATICSGGAVSIPLTANVASTFTWIAANNPNTTGESVTTQTTSTISNTITSTTGNTEVVVYTVSPVSTGGGCTGPAQTVSVTVSPTPVVTVTPSAQTLCSGGTTSIALTSNVTGTTFTWTVAQSGVTGASGSTGSTIAQTLSTTSTSSGTATYTITPTIGSCAGLPATATVTVNPVPVMTSTSSATICSGSTVNIPLSANIGSTFSWIATDNPNTSGESTTTQTTATLSNGITNTTTSVQTVVYTVTPTSTGGSCAGAPQIVTVTVNPTPAMTSSNAATICSGGTVSIPLTANVVSTFTWIAANNANTTGESLTTQSTATLSNTIINSTTSAQTVIYTVTPLSTGGCPGAAQTVSVTVNPTPVVTSASTATICSGATVSIPLTANVASTFSWIAGDNPNTSGESTTSQVTSTLSDLITNNTATVQAVVYTVTPVSTGGSCTGAAQSVTVTVNPVPAMTSASSATICSGGSVSIPLTSDVTSTYTWVAANNPNTTGESITTQTTSTISNTLTSTTGNTEVVVYTVTPTSSGGNCVGSVQTVSVTVSPTPVVTVTPTSQTLCSGSVTSVSLTSNVAGATFTWTVNQSGVSGGSGGSGSVISQTLATTGSTAGSAVYTITPGIGACSGAPATATITVNPVPSLTATPATQGLCSGQATSVSLSSNVTGTTYSWAVTQSGASGASNGSGSTITQTLTATGSASGTADYTITPTANGCSGTPVVVTITVSPMPTVTATPSSQSLCSGSSTSIALTSNVTGTTFSWSATQTGVSGASNSSGSSITETLTTTGATPGTVTYTITPSAGGCPGSPTVVTVTVNPIPAAPSASSNSPVCLNGTINLNAGPVTGATYSWNGPNGFTSAQQSPSIPNATTAEAGTYSVNVTVNGCTGPDQLITVVVNTPPPSTLTPAANSPVCTGQTLNLNIGSITNANWNWSGPNTFTSTTQNPSISNIQLSGAGIYTLTASVPGCAGTGTGTVSVIVNQTPAPPIAGNNGPVCEGSTLNLNANGTGTSYSWTGPAGYSDGNQNPAISNVTLAQAGVYSVTTTDNGCTSAVATTTVVIDVAPTVSAGADQVVCKGTPNASLSGTVTVSNTGTWSSSGTGSFTPNANTLNATYVPSTADTAAGSVTLVLTSTNNGSCAAVTDTMIITYADIPAVQAGPDQTVCGNNINISLNGSVTAGSTTGVWSTSGTGTFSPGNTTLNASYLPSAADTSAGSITLTLTSTGGCIVVTDALTITITDAPVVNAGADIFVCANNPNATYSATIGGATSTGIWTTSGTGSFNPATTALTGTYVPSGADISSGSVFLVLTSTNNGTCNAEVDTVLLTFTTPPTAFAGNDSSFCANSSFNLGGVITGGAGTGNWTTSGSGVFTPNANTLNAIYTPSASDTAAGSVTLTLTSTNNGGCLAATDQVVLTITDGPSIDAGANQTVCANNNVITLNGQVNVSTGISWSTLGDGAFGSSTATSTSYTPGVTDLSSGTVSIVATSTGNGGCVAVTDTMQLVIQPAPVVNAGTDQFLCSGLTSASVSGSVSGVTTTGTWSTLGTGSFTSPNSLSTTYNLSTADTTAGSVTLVLTSTNNGSCNASTDTVVIMITPAGIAAAGADSTICASTASITLSGVISGGTGAGQWSTSGTGTFTPSNTTLNATYSPGAADIASGSVVLTLTPINACLPQADSLVLTIVPTPVADAGVDIFVCASTNTVALNGTITGGTSTGTWTTLGSGSFSPNADSLNAVYTLSTADSAAGSVILVLTSTNNGLCSAVSDTMQIITTSATTALAGADTSICSNDSLVLNGSINGGSSGQWSTSGTGTFSPNNTSLNASYLPSAADVSAGTIMLTLTPANGCNPMADTLILTLNPAAIVSAGSSTVICASTNTVALNGSVTGGSTTGMWSSSGTGTFTPNDSTLNATYTLSQADSSTGSVTLVLTSTNNGSCGAVKDSITVTITTPATAQAGADFTVCANNATVNLAGTVTGGTGQGQWSTSGSGTFAPSDTALNASYIPGAGDVSAGTVLLTLSTLNSCTASTDSLMITITPAPTVNAGTDTTLCGTLDPIGLNGVINAVPTGAVWTTNGSGAFAPNDSTLNAVYTPAPGDNDTLLFVLTTTGNGLCNAVNDTVRIIRNTRPTADFVFANLCLGQSVSFTDSTQGTVATWQWDFGNGSTSVVQNPSTTYTASGTYTVTLEASAGTGCGDSIQKTLTINPTPTASFSVTNFCFGDSVQFTDASAITPGSIIAWNWSFGDGNSSALQNPVHSYDSAQVYTVNLTVQSDSGCAAVATQTISINPVPLAGFSLASNCGTLLVNYTDTSSVSGDSITVWNWNFGDGNTSGLQNPANTYASTGTYTVLLQVQTASGCADTASAVVTLGQNIVANYIPAGGSYNTNQGISFTNQSTGGTTYNWNFGDSNTSTDTDPSHSFTQPGTYTVTLVASNTLGCTDTIAYVFDINTTGVTVPTGFTPDGDGLNDFFYVLGGPFTAYELHVFNEWGNEIFMSNAQADKWDGTYKGVKQPAGTYIYVFNGTTADGKSIKLQNEVNIIR